MISVKNLHSNKKNHKKYNNKYPSPCFTSFHLFHPQQFIHIQIQGA